MAYGMPECGTGPYVHYTMMSKCRQPLCLTY